MVNIIIYFAEAYSHDQNYWRITDFSPPQQIFQTTRRQSTVCQSLPQNMPNLVVRKSGRTIKRKTSPSTRSDTDSTSRSVPKRVKQKPKPPRRDTITVAAADDDSDSESPLPVPAWVPDVSNEIFVLQKSCMLGSTPIIEDSDFVRLGEFSFRQFETSAIRKLTKATEEGKTSFEWISGKAVISSKSMRIADSLSIEVEDENGWRKVEKGVERWMLQSKKEIIVKLTILYKKSGVTNAESSDDEALSSKKVRPSQYC